MCVRLRIHAYGAVPAVLEPQDVGLQQLVDAVAAVQHEKPTQQSFEGLYRVVETACTAGKDAVLYSKLRQQCGEHLHRCLSTLLQYPLARWMRLVFANDRSLRIFGVRCGSGLCMSVNTSYTVSGYL